MIMNEKPIKKLTNKRLVNYLMEHSHIDMVTVSKTHVIATVSKKFLPSEVPAMIKVTGQVPRLSSDQDGNYIVFNRYDR